MQNIQQTDLSALDAILLDSPFGNSKYITAQLHHCYTRRIHHLAAQMPSASRLATLLEGANDRTRYEVFGDMVFRCAVQHAIRQDQAVAVQGLSLQDSSRIFDEISSLITTGRAASIKAGLTDRLGSAPHLGSIWRADAGTGPLWSTFAHLVEQHYDEAPCAPTSDDVAMLRQGVALLDRLLPSAAKSALSHTHVVALFSPDGAWKTRCSSSEYWLSGSIFLSRQLTVNAWSVAEHVYHESLHQQMYDLRQAHSLLEEGFDRDDAPTIISLWNMPGSKNNNAWDVHRSIAAFHVYVHLALLATLAEASSKALEAEYGPRSMTPAKTAIVRARYLEEQLRGPFWAELGPAGRKFVDWFGAVLNAVNQSPPPAGARMHLLLDRYRREAREIEAHSRERLGAPGYSATLENMVERETAIVRSLLVATDRQDALHEFEHSVREVLAATASSQGDDERSGRQFALTRRAISRSLLALSPDGYTLPGAPVTTDMVEAMVQSASETVRMVVGR